MLLPSDVHRSAVLSADGLYRYQLKRVWAADRPLSLWVMLNPSTADGEVDDPTLTKVITYAKAFGHGAVVVCNLYGLRSTDPDQLLKADDPIGPATDQTLARWAMKADVVVCAWGSHKAVDKRHAHVRYLLTVGGDRLTCLGRNRDGQPGHPLYLPAARRLEPL